jgi:hypothetical protein
MAVDDSGNVLIPRELAERVLDELCERVGEWQQWKDSSYERYAKRYADAYSCMTQLEAILKG